MERIINEPSAAALACRGLDEENDETFLVFDFGGGTLDVSLVDCFDNIIEIIAVSGDNHLGGSDFDKEIAVQFAGSMNWSLSIFLPRDKESFWRAPAAPNVDCRKRKRLS